MATVVLVRHGRTEANASGILAGRSAGVGLDAVGLEQAVGVGDRLAVVPLHRLVCSPLERCRRTARAISLAQRGQCQIVAERRLTECDYGSWQGRTLKELSKEKLWRVVQAQPSAARFPGGESLGEMQARAVAAIRRIDAEVEAAAGLGAVWAAVSHADVIKAVLNDALGAHLDHFQRIQVDPASVSVIRYAPDRPFVMSMNTHAGDLSWLVTPRRAHRQRDAVVGGGAGPET
jgi:probable phosphomutase (TIGR03848 family)